jgi:hypothetical protein
MRPEFSTILLLALRAAIILMTLRGRTQLVGENSNLLESCSISAGNRSREVRVNRHANLTAFKGHGMRRQERAL